MATTLSGAGLQPTPERAPLGSQQLSPLAVDNCVDEVRKSRPEPGARAGGAIRSVTDQPPGELLQQGSHSAAGFFARGFFSLTAAAGSSFFGSSLSSSSMPMAAISRRRSTTRALTLPAGNWPCSFGEPASAPTNRS